MARIDKWVENQYGRTETVSAATVLDCRGVAYVSIEDGTATQFTYSWVDDPDAVAHGTEETTVDPSADTLRVQPAGHYMRIVPTGGDVKVHFLV